MFHLFTNMPFTGYDFVFITLVVIALAIFGYSYRKNFLGHIHYAYSKPAMIGLLIFLSTDIINTIFFRYQIISAAAFLLGGYCLLGFYIDRKVWIRGVFLAVIITLTLPFIEHIQTFLGFPVRLMTAKIVSVLLHWMGAANISDATVIMTENHASVIDLPCSGVKSIYTGILFLCALYFFQRVAFSLRMALVSLAYFVSLLFFNIWRVFSLVYIYGILQWMEVGNNLHVALGAGGFVASGLLAWFLTKKYLSPIDQWNKRTVIVRASLNTKKQWFVASVIFCFLLVDIVLAFGRLQHPQISSFSHHFSFQLEGVAFKDLVLTKQEQSFFQNRDVIFTKKYKGQTSRGLPFTLLLVSSKSWRTHHNPEICLQGMGYHIDHSDLVQLHETRVREVVLSQNQGTVLYWFVSNDQVISDYSERVWAGILHPDKVWTLVEMGFDHEVDLDHGEIMELIQKINKALKYASI